MDLLDSVGYDKIKEIEKINPRVPKFYTSYADLDMDNIIITADESMSHLEQPMHHHGIKSMQYQFTGAIDRQLFYQFILRLPDNVLRLKEYVKFRDNTK